MTDQNNGRRRGAPKKRPEDLLSKNRYSMGLSDGERILFSAAAQRRGVGLAQFFRDAGRLAIATENRNTLQNG